VIDGAAMTVWPRRLIPETQAGITGLPPRYRGGLTVCGRPAGFGLRQPGTVWSCRRFGRDRCLAHEIPDVSSPDRPELTMMGG